MESLFNFFKWILILLLMGTVGIVCFTPYSLQTYDAAVASIAIGMTLYIFDVYVGKSNTQKQETKLTQKGA